MLKMVEVEVVVIQLFLHILLVADHFVAVVVAEQVEALQQYLQQ
jgi:hypothetical protein